jgi:hypothetical protein
MRTKRARTIIGVVKSSLARLVEVGLAASILIVALIATISGALAIPLGIFVGLHPLTVYVLVVSCATAVAWTLLLGGHKLRASVAERLGHGEHTETRTKGVLDRYGSVGLGLIGPLFPGVLASTISGVAVDIEPKHLGRWLTVGIATWFGFYTIVWWLVDRTLFG